MNCHNHYPNRNRPVSLCKALQSRLDAQGKPPSWIKLIPNVPTRHVMLHHVSVYSRPTDRSPLVTNLQFLDGKAKERWEA
mmetsp:Transcript_523/g.681  ORF Transcript_523/g.681 Transcript_523/m.681 type:complete len:80 (-) Transcript_523:6-245(-)